MLHQTKFQIGNLILTVLSSTPAVALIQFQLINGQAVYIEAGTHLYVVLVPAALGGWLTLVGLIAIGLTVAQTTGAYGVARRGRASRSAPAPAGPQAIPIPPQDLDV